jgi:putative nucleotidyltransferase with HDIG domain
MKKEIAALVKQIEAIPPLPVVARQIMELLQDEAVAMKKIAELVEKDISLATRLLTLANSPFYGTLGKVSSIDHAMVLLGLNEVRAVLMAVSVHKFFSSKQNSSKNAVSEKRSLWRHAIVCSQTAKMLATHFKVQGADAIFLAALLHDVGKVAMECFQPSSYEKVTTAIQTQKCSFSKAEHQTLGATHYQVAAKILQQWKFPGRIILPVFFHHAPWHAKEFGNEAAILYLANCLTHMAGYPTLTEEPETDLQQFAASNQCLFLVRSGLDLDARLLERLVEQIRIFLAENPQLLSFLENGG